MVSVYEKIDTSALPEEYLPDDYKGPSAGKIKDIVGKREYKTGQKNLLRVHGQLAAKFFFNLKHCSLAFSPSWPLFHCPDMTKCWKGCKIAIFLPSFIHNIREGLDKLPKVDYIYMH